MEANNLAKQASGRELRTLIVDIERLPGEFSAEFWDLNAFKNRRIHADLVTKWPQTICVAAMWYGEKDFIFHAAWHKGGEKKMLEEAYKLYDQADIVITYNGINFDNKHLQSGWLEHGMGKPSPWRDVDLLRVARQSFGFESKTLDAVCKRLNIDAKNDKYSIDVARAAMDGDVAAQNRLQRYNKNDVKITGQVYERLLPYIKSHPHVAPNKGLDNPVCPRCSSAAVKRNGYHSTGVNRYQRYKCNSCGGSFRTTYESRGPSVHAI